MTQINFISRAEDTSTAIPNVFIDEYIPKANHTYAIIYIYLYRHYIGGFEISVKDIALDLKALESDVQGAIEYWQSQGLIDIVEDGGICSLEFLPAISQNSTKDLKINSKTKIQKQQEVEPEIKGKTYNAAVENDLAKDLKDDFNLISLTTKPSYDVRELELYQQESQEVRTLFKTAETYLEKMLSYNDLNILFGIYDWLRMPTDLIIYLLETCVSNDHRSLRYIEKVAIDWTEKGINSLEKAKEMTTVFQRDYREIMKANGQSGRNPTKSEISYMDKWVNEYNLPLEIILEACDKTIMSLGKPKFSYTDKILCEWESSGVKSVEDIKKLEADYYNKAKLKNEQAVNFSHAKQSKFVNFKQRSLDYDAIEQKEREILSSKISK